MMITVFKLLQRNFRRARMRAFLNLFAVEENTRILDVGGTPDIWLEAPTPSKIVLLNIPGTPKPDVSGRFVYAQGDGCSLPFADRSFDIVFSNSVIEHVGSASNQKKFASEIARVGKSYWVQTPNRYFPVETHLFTPIVHLLPRPISNWIFRRFSVWALIYRPSPAQKFWYHDHFINQIRLLAERQMAELFPHAAIRSERFLLWKKSLIAAYQPEDLPLDAS